MKEHARRETVEYVDRYSATGIKRPNPWTGCKRCEGMGLYPVPWGDLRR